MEIHHTKHHQAYIDNLNKALEKHPELQEKTLVDLLTSLDSLPSSIQAAVRNNGGGHYNHSFFWLLMKKNGGGHPSGDLADAIKKTFGNFEVFQDQFNAAAKAVFGSGWAWLCLDAEGNLVVISTPNQDTPLAKNMKPIMGLDVWEHAYYLKYQNKRLDYITGWWHVINWEYIEEHFRSLIVHD